MSVGYNDDFVSALEELAKRLQLVDETTFKAIHAARDQWTALAAINAIQRLGRPHWLLAQSITNKVCDYYDNRKVHAMYGFRFRAGRRLNVKARTRGVYLPDPGYYGQYFEGGKRRGGTPYKTPDHFLRKAKMANIHILGDLLKKNFNDAMKKTLKAEIARIRAQRKDARRQGKRLEPEFGWTK